MPSAELLAMRGICKSFGAVRAADHVDLTLQSGDVLGLLGENGAGKTTLMNILFGGYAADEGSIAIEGQPVLIHSSADALALGIGMVHQHFHLVARHTVLENLIVGRKGRGLRLDRASAFRPTLWSVSSPSASSSAWRSSRRCSAARASSSSTSRRRR